MYCLCRSSKTISLRIIFLDDADFLYEIQKELLGEALLEVVFNRLNILETSYFGLRYIDLEGQTHWLDANSRLSRQLKENKDIYELYFSVKFYAVDPCKLVEEITRYQFYLQLKQDVLQGRLPVPFDLAAQLGAYVVQSELGDYDGSKHTHGYVSEFRFIPNQTKDLEYRIGEIHKQLKGVGPAQAEFNYLDKVKWLDLYGVDLHPVLGEDSVEYFLGLTPSGIIVLRNKTTVAHYYWPRIAKVYFKGRYFMLRVCDKNNEVSTYGFETPKKAACKHLWKCCVEHHAFFRLVRVSPSHTAGDFFSLGSRFRYSGKATEHKASKDASNINRVPPYFTRRPSRRQIIRNSDSNYENKQSFETTAESKRKLETKSISVPQPAYTIDNVYRSTHSIPASFNNNNSNINNNNINNSRANSKYSAPDSPRSTRSAGWIKTQQRGLFGITSSPKSVRSASSRNGNNHTTHTSHRHRSSSVESQSSNDSRSGRRHRSRSKRLSDNESEMSRGSGRSGRSHRKHRRHRSRNRSGGESESRDYNYNSEKYGGSESQPELIDSGKQWIEVQRKQAEKLNMGTVQQASVIKSNTAPKSNHSTDTYSRNKKHRKHRSPTDARNSSNNNNSKIWSSELTRHLQFDLIDTTGMTEDQLKEIPYTVVETNAQNRKRTSNSTSSLKVHHKNAYGNKDRVDRIRGPQMPSSDKSIIVTHDGSIRSGSTNSSSQDFDRNNGLNRMISSLSIGEFANSSNLNRIDYAGIRLSHEHTDSGLGDQDYAYSSERSSDSAKYTNKSSGTSSILSANIHHSKFYAGNRHHRNDNQFNTTALPPTKKVTAASIISTAPVHKKFVNKANHSDSNNNSNNNLNNNNNFINRFINKSTHSQNYSKSLSLNRHTTEGVGCITLTSPYAYTGSFGVGNSRGGTKSDIGIPIMSASARHQHSSSSSSSSRNNLMKKSRVNDFLHKSNSTLLPSVHSDLSLYDVTLSHPKIPEIRYDILNNNNISNIETPMSSPNTLKTANSSTKLLYTNKHRFNINPDNLTATDNNKNVSNYHGPLVFKNDINGGDRSQSEWNNSVFDNPIMTQSSEGGGSVAVVTTSTTTTSSISTNDNDKNVLKNCNNSHNKSSSLELILTPIIQSRRRSKH